MCVVSQGRFVKGMSGPAQPVYFEATCGVLM